MTTAQLTSLLALAVNLIFCGISIANCLRWNREYARKREELARIFEEANTRVAENMARIHCESAILAIDDELVVRCPHCGRSVMKSMEPQNK